VLTLRSQLALRSRFEGFRSRWRTSAEWSAFNARRVCARQAVVAGSWGGGYLVDEILTVVVAQTLRSDHAVEVGLHELLDEIDIPERLEAGRLEDVEDGDDVFVAKVAEQLDLAEGAQTEHGVVKRRDALDGDLALRRLVHGRARAVSARVSGLRVH